MDKYYAGIGSRETPEPIQQVMRHCAGYLYSEGWILRSGAAPGADWAFESGASAMNQEYELGPRKEIFLPWKNHNSSTSDLHPDKYPFTEWEITFAAQHHPAWHKVAPGFRPFHYRNTRILLGLNSDTPVKFILCWTPGARITGGTGQALRTAQTLNIPVINFGQAKTAHDVKVLMLMMDELQKTF